MTKKPTDESLFKITINLEGCDIKSNLTKREYFAGIALGGLVTKYGYTINFNDAVLNAKRFADAMLTQEEDNG